MEYILEKRITTHKICAAAAGYVIRIITTYIKIYYCPVYVCTYTRFEVMLRFTRALLLFCMNLLYLSWLETMPWLR